CFFFQAEDGIRGFHVTGVQTCALPILDRAYVRRAGEAETWLADGVPEVAAKASEWLDDRLFNLPKERIAEITVRHDNGEELRLSRADAAAEFTLDQLPKGRTLKTYGGHEPLASSCAFLTFAD